MNTYGAHGSATRLPGSGQHALASPHSVKPHLREEGRESHTRMLQGPGSWQRQAALALQARDSLVPGMTHPHGQSSACCLSPGWPCPGDQSTSREEACRKDRKSRQKAY